MATEFDAASDATRRTRLANERTYLAWWRTGLTTLAVSLAAGRLVPELSGGIVGVAFRAYGYLRHREVDDALSRGECTALPNRVAVLFTAVGGLLGLATILLVLLHAT
jgi:putative membrane protein